MKLLLTSLLSLIILPAFSFSDQPNNEEKKKNKGQKQAQKVMNNFCSYVPSGTVIFEGDTSSIQAFYISSSEITNFEYAEFLFDLKRTGEEEKLKIAQIDSTGWSKMNGSMQSMVDYYSSHPAYRNYPVVNITKEGAILYCEWLSEKYKTMYGEDVNIKFRLPTRLEWLRAASGGTCNDCDYAWGSNQLTDEKGAYLANHLTVESQHIKRNPETNQLEVVQADEMSTPTYLSDNSLFTAPVKSYDPNDYGIYDLNGNVAEIIADGDYAVGGSWHSPGFDIRNQSIEPINGSSATTGFRIIATYLPN